MATSTLRRPSPITDDDVTAGSTAPSAPTASLKRTPLAFGGAQMTDAQAIGSLASRPDASLPPTAAFGTRVGTALRGEAKDLANAGVTALNGVQEAGAATSNALTAPIRYGAGFARDVFNGLAGNPESPNAGKPLPGIQTAPLARPFLQSPPGAGSRPDFAGVQGSASTTAPARGPVDVAASPTGLQRPSLAGVQGGSLGTVKGDLPSDVYGGARAVDGTRLPYGAMVDGVPTFSDGSGGIRRTVTNETIRTLGDRLQTAPSPKAPLASDVLGYTPTPEQAASLVRPTAVPITGSRPTAQQFAASERDAIASGDWRSAAGTVASNLQKDAQYAGTPRLRRAAAQTLGAQLAGSLRAGEQAVGANNEAAIDSARNANALALENLRGQYGLQQGALDTARTLLTRQLPQTTLADGTIALVGPDGVATPARLPDGAPARAAVTRDDSATKRENDILDQLGKGVQAQMEEHAKAQALLPESERQPVTPQQIADWRNLQAKALGLNVVRNKAGEQMVYLNGAWRSL